MLSTTTTTDKQCVLDFLCLCLAKKWAKTSKKANYYSKTFNFMFWIRKKKFLVWIYAFDFDMKWTSLHIFHVCTNNRNKNAHYSDVKQFLFILFGPQQCSAWEDKFALMWITCLYFIFLWIFSIKIPKYCFYRLFSAFTSTRAMNFDMVWSLLSLL